MEIIISAISLIIAAIALVISIFSFFSNSAKHNLSQLQEQFFRFNDKFQILLDFANYNLLTNFKYDLENILIYDNENLAINYNNLQKNDGLDVDLCKKAYTEVIENMGFFEVPSYAYEKPPKNEFVKWLNTTLNAFYFKLNIHYTLIYDINELAYFARGGVLKKEVDNIINNFYGNIYELAIYREALIVLKKEMVEAFNKVRINNLKFFSSNASAIQLIGEHMMSFMQNCGIQELIHNHDYTKISSVYLGITDVYKQTIADEEKDFNTFIHALIKKS